MKILSCLFSYEITKGMKSRGPIGLLKKNNDEQELILKQIAYLDKIFKHQDIYVMTGFGAEKIQKKLPKHVTPIINSHFNNFNQVYALKLLINSLPRLAVDYDGLFIMNSDILLKALPKINYEESWIVTKHKHNKTSDDYLLGVGLDNARQLNTIFYNVGEALWCNAVYLCKKDLLSIIDNIHQYYDNMFLFELINKSIDTLKLTISSYMLPQNNDCVIIKGPKDKYKII